MTNKNDKINLESDNENSMKVNAKGRIRFNVVDFFVVLFVVLVLVASVAYFIPEVTAHFAANGEVEITYVLEFRGVDDDFIANVLSGDNAYESSQNFSMGTVKAVSTEAYSSLEYDNALGEAVLKDHPAKKTLVITITSTAVYTEGEGYSINGKRIAVGAQYNVRFPNFSGSAYCTQVKLSSK
jgi:hypothetical protein